MMREVIVMNEPSQSISDTAVDPASIWNWCSRCQHGDESRERPVIVHRTALTPAFLRSGEPNQGGELNWVMPIIGTIAGKVDNMAQVQGLGYRFDVPWALLLR